MVEVTRAGGRNGWFELVLEYTVGYNQREHGLYIPITSKEASPFRGNHLLCRGGRQSEGVAEGVVSLLGSKGLSVGL